MLVYLSAIILYLIISLLKAQCQNRYLVNKPAFAKSYLALFNAQLIGKLAILAPDATPQLLYDRDLHNF